MAEKDKGEQEIAEELACLRKRVVQLEREKAQAENALQERMNELIRSERQAFVGRMSANIAHEVRNPLVNVSMAVSEVKNLLGDPNGGRFIGIIEKNVKRIDFLIGQLLESARPPELQLRRHNIHRLLDDVLETITTNAAKQKVKISRGFTSKRSILIFDKEQMQRVFLNLITNAIESMPKEGTLSVTTEYQENVFLTRIEDTGRGISDEDLLRIFDPFFSSKHNGVGLGLTICYGVVVNHGGNIEVESKPGRGTSFTVSLPLAPPPTPELIGEQLR